MKKIYLFLVLSLLGFASYAQTAASYSFSASSGTFSSISSTGTSASGAISDDITQTGISIGFSFTFCGTSYTTLSACSNGFLSLSNTSGSPYSNATSNITGAGMLMPFWDDLKGYSGTSNAYYQTSGSAPNRTFTFEWNDWGVDGTGGSGYSTFQVILHETTNTIQYVYSPISYSSMSATIGIANSTSDYLTLSDNSSAPSASSSTFYTSTITSSPASGQIYTFTPPVIVTATPSTLAFGGVTTGTSSASQTFAIAATSLASSDSLTVTAPTGFLISRDGTTWVTSYSIDYSTSSISDSTVYVEFTPTSSTSYSGNITITGGGLSTAVDVAVSGTGASACSASPTAGTATITPAIGGASTPFTVSLSGTTVAGGLTYQWQSSSSGSAGTFTNISGATNFSYSFTGISAATYFRCVVICPSYSGDTSTVATAAVSVATASCTPSPIYASNSCSIYYMTFDSVNLVGSVGSIHDGAACDGSGYKDETALSCTLYQGVSYNISIQTGSSYEEYTQFWIDFNGDGTFQSTESVGGNTTLFRTSGVVSISIPSTAPAGLYRMRGVMDYQYDYHYYPSMNPCMTGYYYGEGRDYSIVIAPMPTCSGTPAAGTVVSSVTTACPSESITLTLTGYTTASSLTFQWQSSADSSTWTNISGATGTSYTTTESAATYFRCQVTCTVSSVTVSSPGTRVGYIGVCYCTPSYSSAATACSDGYGITNFSVTGESSTAINDVTSCNGSGYLDQTSLSVTMEQSYTYSAYVQNGYAYFSVQTWIDFDNDGTFASSESLGGNSSYYNSTSYNITIPITAATGNHRMRVATIYTGWGSSYPSIDPCISSSAGYLYGEVRDYTVNIIPLPACTGTPTAGTATSSVGTACPSESITLTLTGFTTAGSLGFQWQSSADSSTWTNISGATATTYTTTESATTYFRCIVTCTASSSSATSVPVKVNYIGVCYCTPNYYDAAYSCTYGYYSIASFTVTGESSTSISDYASCDGSGYLDRTALSVNFMQGNTYTPYITNGYSELTVQTWIDFNNDGTFQTSESVGGLNEYYYSTSYSITMPITAPLGNHRMRVVTSYYYLGGTYPSVDPCVASGYYYGETRDYTVNIVPLPACTGTPTAGTASSTVTTACPSEAIVLNITGFTTAGSLGFQWQSSADSATWTNISGATTIPYTTTESAATYYRCVVTCTASGSSANSSPVHVNYIGICYCTPSYSSPSTACSDGYGISSFTVSGESSTAINDYASCDGSGYLDQTALTVSFEQSYTYSCDVSNGYAYFSVQTWIDFNDDGTFAASESLGGSSSYYYSTSYNITIPITAATGNHRMRVATIYTGWGSSYPSIDPCISSSAGYLYGEVRDYTANIIGLPACTGTPTAGTAAATIGTGCPSESFSLTLTGFTSAGSLAFQWQSSSDSTTWTNISGATTIPYTVSSISAATYYRCVVTCTATSSTVYSNIVFVNYSSVCYCTPTFYYNSYACTDGMDIAQFSINGESSTAINDLNACDGTGYEDRTTLHASLEQGFTYTVTVAETSTFYSVSDQVWIDFNDNGTFESTESVGGVSSYSNSTTFPISIPVSATVGAHRMRVVQLYASYGTTYPSISSCPTATYPYYYGEARDYIVNIIALPACSGTPSAGIVSAPGIACPSSTIALSLTGGTTLADLTYQWQVSSDSTTWTNISGATTLSYSTTETAARYYRAIVTCSIGGASDTTHFAYVMYHSTCPCTPTYYYYTIFGSSYAASHYAMNNFSLNGYSGTSINDNGPSAAAASGYEDRTSIGITLEQGGTYAGTITYTVSDYGYQNMIWIDFNDDGTFATSEEVTGVIGTAGYTSVSSNTFNVNIPITATTGVHLMRVRNAETYNGAIASDMDPCNYSDYVGGSSFYYDYGMTRDYSVNTVTLPPCTGTPTGGTSAASVGTACPSETFTLSATGYTVAGSLVMQWQSSSDSSTWTDISGATSTSYTTSESSTKYYRLKVTCTPTSNIGYSTVVKVNYIGVCYCTPSYTYGSLSCSSYGMNISSFTVYGGSGTYIADSSACTGSGYEDKTALSVNMEQGFTYTASLTSTATYYSMNTQTWIDFNDNGTFETTESVGGYNGYTTSTSYPIAIPMDATTGYHRMREMVTYASSYYDGSYPTMNPCPSGYPYYYGETRDYTVNITPLPACSGTPTAGAASSSPSSACPSSTFSLQLSGSTLATSLTYQWQSSTDGTTWTNITGATTVPFVTSETSSHYYRCEVTCSIGGASGYSTPAYVVYIGACYCVPYYYDAYSDCDFGYSFTSFVVAGEAGTSIDDAAPCDGSTGYEDHTSMSVEMAQGSSYSANINFPGFSFYGDDVQMWIDFNDNGTFESSETVGGYSAYTGSSAFTISIPTASSGGTLGAHRMRLVTVMDGYYTTGAAYPSLDPCTSGYYYGQARDYTVNIVGPVCTGTPSAGTISATTTIACSSFTSTITASAFTRATAAQFQWQSSSDSSTWSDISGATDTSYAASITSGTTYFRFMDSCTASSSAGYSAGIGLRVITAPVVSPISGTTVVCPGAAATVTLSDATTGGTWSSLHTTIATVGSTTGVVTGVAAGADTIRYTVTNMCGTTYVSDTIRVNPAPVASAISGLASVCPGDSVTLTETAVGGTWSASNTNVTINAHGVVTGETAGLDTISYSVTNSCGTATATYVITVNPAPDAGVITGLSSVCATSSIILSSTVSGGTWSISNGNASISGTTVTGVMPGLDTVSYTRVSTCGSATATFVVTVNPLPNAGTITGTDTAVCPGVTITLVDTASGGTWSSSNALATVSSTGIVTGVTAGADTITYSVTTVCGTASTSQPITVLARATVGSISGVTVVCEASSITLHEPDTTGSWSAANGHAAVSGGVVTGVTYGPDTIYYTVTNTCNSAIASYPITVTPLPEAGSITDSVSFICSGGSTIFVDTVSGGVWSSSSTAVATVSSYGVVHGVSGGSVIISLSVTNSCGTAIAILPFTVNPTPVPGTVFGTDSVCVAATVTYADTSGTSGGTWSSSNPGVASVDPTSGIVYGSSPGTATITYTVATASCGTVMATRGITVHALPYAGSITGSSSVCAGSAISLSDAGGTTGGTWSSSASGTATVAPSTGVVLGVTAGNATITYTATTVSCGSAYTTAPVTVYALPYAGAITGLSTVCAESSITLADHTGTAGGVWTSSDTSVATVNSTSGVVTGVSAGTSMITYTAVTASCGTAYTISTITVRPLPVPGTITGRDTVCPGTSVALADAAGSGVWHSTNSHASVTGAGVVTGVSLGLDTISYAVTNSCGTLSATMPIVITSLPHAGTVSGPSTVCFGASITLSDTVSGGSWNTSNANATVSGGVVTGLNVGGVVIFYNIVTSCGTATASDSINVLPILTPSLVTTATPSASVCTGDYVTYTAIPTNGGPSPSIIWKVNSMFASSALIFGNIPSTGDVVTCQMVSDAACAIGGTVFAAPINITVNEIVTPSVTVVPSVDSVSFLGEVVTFTATVVNGGSAPTYAWYVDGVLQSGASGSTFSMSVGHSVAVSCAIVSNAPCAEPGSIGSNLVNVYADNEGVNNVTKGLYSLSLYPNPNNGTFVLNGLVNSGSNELSYQVLDMTGKVVFSGTTTPKKGVINQQINLDGNLASGQYIMRVLMENGAEFIHFTIAK